MRTTVRLDDDLLRQAKARAAELDTTLNEFVVRALRVALASRVAPSDRPPIPVERGGCVQPGVDLDDAASLLELMDAPEPAYPFPSVRRVAERGPNA